MPSQLSVVVSQGNSNHPAKRQLEEDIVTGLMLAPGVDVTVVPNLYDLSADSTGMLALKGLSGDLVVCSWMFERAARWCLDRNAVTGQEGTTLLQPDEDDDEDDDEEELEEETKPRVVDRRQMPSRRIWCLDLKLHNQAAPYLEEIERIRKERAIAVVSLAGPTPGGNAVNGSAAGTIELSAQALPTAAQRDRFRVPTNSTALDANGNGLAAPTSGVDESTLPAGIETGSPVRRIDDAAPRRWYPVIDYSRCTNCLECIDFCLFGVYGMDKIDTILVEQPDNCRKGCPACSRVCPENAIIFPQHKTPAIAGSNEAGSSLKIDLSQLFGAPEEGKSAAEIAAIERDEQLMLAGRDAVGMNGATERRAQRRSDPASRDDLDDLVDQLDELDL